MWKTKHYYMKKKLCKCFIHFPFQPQYFIINFNMFTTISDIIEKKCLYFIFKQWKFQCRIYHMNQATIYMIKVIFVISQNSLFFIVLGPKIELHKNTASFVFFLSSSEMLYLLNFFLVIFIFKFIFRKIFTWGGGGGCQTTEYGQTILTYALLRS